MDDEDQLYRRVFPYHIADRRVSTAAFKDRRKKPLHKFSADLAKLTTPGECLARGELPGLRLIGFLARTPRRLGFRVWYDPERDNFAHCSVEGENSPDKCHQLARESWPTELSA